MSMGYNNWLFGPCQQDIIVDLYIFVVGNVIDLDSASRGLVRGY